MSDYLAVEDPPFDPWPVGSTGSVGSVGSDPGVLNRVREWLGRFILTVDDADLDLLTLWAAHTHLCDVLYTTPRLVLDSPVPGAGKTTTCEHLQRLCRRPLQAASLSSPAMLARLLDKELRTILIDEVDRNLDPKRPGVEDLIAIINAGYKRGATRPVLVPGPKGDWDVKEMPTFSPVVLAGNAPNLPEDTRSRTIRVLLLPDLEGRVETSDWEEIEADAMDLGEALSQWADETRETVRATRPELPPGCVGRTKERWNPLRRVAEAAGGHWPDVADDLIRRDLIAAQMDREDGMVTSPPAVTLLRDIAELWPEATAFVPTAALVADLVMRHPRMWGPESAYGKALTAQRMGRMLAQGFKVHSGRQGDGPRGYYRQALSPVWRRMGITPPDEPTELTKPAEPTAGGAW
ncbi:DUF3631 domain-containing protein [Actinotalea ferrariae]|nr:DUF3631 domain-containing protein [Actinotalea ferrariae]